MRQACEHSIVDGNHSAKMDRFELGACDRQTDRRTDGSQHCLLLPMGGVIKIRIMTKMDLLCALNRAGLS